MKMSVSISHIWELAAREAIAAEYKEILPEHFFLAMLKFSEIRCDEIEKVAAGEQAVQALREDVDAIRSELEERQVDPGALRRAIRPALGIGGNAYEGGEIHRSSGSRECFDKAAIIAADAQSDVMTGQHLLAALFASPTPLISGIMGKAIAQDPKKRAAAMPLLAIHSKDLTSEAERMPCKTSQRRIPEARAVLRALGEEQRHCVLLATDMPATAQAVVLAAASLLTTKGARSNLKGWRFVDISDADIGWQRGCTDRVLFAGFLAEAASARNVILYIPPLDASANSGRASDWEDAVRSMALPSTVPLVSRLATSFQEDIAKNPVWRKASQIITLRDTAQEDIPDAL